MDGLVSEEVRLLPGGGDRDRAETLLSPKVKENPLPDWYILGDGEKTSNSTKEIFIGCLEGARRGFSRLRARSRGVRLSMMVDSGATVNLLKTKKVRQLESKMPLTSEPVNIVIKGLGGASLRCTRAILVPLEVDDDIICTWMLETPDNWHLKSMEGFDGLLGQEFLSLPGHELVLLKDGKPLNLEHDPPNDGTPETDEVQICCTVQEDVDLSPGQGVCTYLQPTGDLPLGSELIIPSASMAETDYCFTKEIKIDPRDADKLPLTIFNHGDGTLSLTAGDRLTLIAHRASQEEALAIERPRSDADVPQQKLVTEAAEADDDELDAYLKYDPSVVKDKPVKYDNNRANLVLTRLQPASWELEDSEQIERVMALIRKKQKAFHLPTEPLTTTHVIKHHIDTGDAAPVRQGARFIPHKIRSAVESETEGLIRNGQAVLSDSPWNCNIVMVKRKHGEHYRMCTDSRSLNAVTSPTYFPIPRIEDILSRAAQCKWFSSLDLRSAYSQVPLTEESIPKTAFSTHNGKYAYKVMPFGLIGAPATFQRLMHIVFNDVFNEGVSAFLDNIDLFHSDFEQHLQVLEKVLDRLIEANLKLSPEKTFIFRKSIKSLGHQISHNSIKPDHDKVEAIKSFPAPTTKKGVRQFLGLSGYYRRFIARYAHMAAPLHHLTKQETEFTWGEKEQEAFDQLKDALAKEPVLTAPDFDKPYVIFCDASDLAIGSVLCQLCPETKKYKPISYMSRVLKGSEKSYLIYEKEALSVVEAASKFKPYIWGQQCEIFTDNSVITYLFGKSSEKNARAARWSLNLQAQNIKVSHVPGKCNVVADCLSRPREASQTVAMIDCIPELGNTSFTLYHRGKESPTVGAKLIGTVCQAEVDHVGVKWEVDTLKRLQKEDKIFGEVIDHLMDPKKALSEQTIKKVPDVDQFYIDGGLLYKRVVNQGKDHDVIVVPTGMKHQAMQLAHDHVSAGHPGPDRSIKRARKYFFWLHMTNDIKSFVGNCTVCQRVKTGGNPLMPLKTFPTPKESWETVSADLVGPLPMTERGNKYLLVMVDHLSRYCALAALPNKTADEVADKITQICAFLNFPKIILSDQGKEFRCATMSALAKHHGFENHYTAVFHPASNGMCERKNRDVVTTIRATIDVLHEEWDRCLPAVQLALNTGYHRAIGDSPHFVMFGKDELRSKLTFQLPTTYDPDLRYALTQRIYETVSENLRKSHQEYSRYRDTKVTKSREPLTVGARVFIKNLKRKSKLDPLWVGPMRVHRKVGAAQFELIDLCTGRKFHRHGEHIVAKRQADLNRWQFPECDEPFPQELRDNDLDPAWESSVPEEDSSHSDSDSEEDSIPYEDMVDDLVGDVDLSRGEETNELNVETSKPLQSILRAPQPVDSPGSQVTPKRTRPTVNFDTNPEIREFSQPGPATVLDDNSDWSSDDGGVSESASKDTGESSRSVSPEASAPRPGKASRKGWMAELVTGSLRRLGLRQKERKDYKAMHEGRE